MYIKLGFNQIKYKNVLILVSQKYIYRVPTAHRKQGKWAKKIPCQEKHREFRNFAKTQGIWFAQVVNYLILRVKDIPIFAVKISIFFKLDKSAKSVLGM